MTIAIHKLHAKKEHTPRRPGAVPGWPVNVLSTPRGVLSLDDASLMFNLCDRLYRNGMPQNEFTTPELDVSGALSTNDHR